MNGVLLLDKALGLSSNRAMQEVKRLLGIKKLGHTGSLDPLATGMLPICMGDATKFAQYLLDADKEYEVQGLLGQQTTTGDTEGVVMIEKSVPHYSEQAIQEAVQSFHGHSYQIPPMYSALKFQGQPLYRYALQGIECEREARPIYIHRIELLAYHWPSIQLRVVCSKGTYIRTLIEDIAKKLGNYAHVTALHRVSTAGFCASQMIKFVDLEQLSIQERFARILPVDVMLQQFPKLQLDTQDARKIQQGQILSGDHLQHEGTYRLYGSSFIGLGTYFHDKGLIAKRMCQS